MARRAEIIHVYIGPDEQVRKELRSLFDAAGRKIMFVDAETVAPILPNIEVLLCGVSPRLDWSIANRLQLLHFMGAGIDHLWPATGLDSRVVIANARGIHAMEMRDHTLAMLLAFERELLRTIEQQRAKQWMPFFGGTLSGKTLGLIGLGEVGLPIAQAAKALGMRVIGMRNRPIPAPDVDEIITFDQISRMLTIVDYLVVTAPLTSRTRGMIGARELAQLPQHAVLVVISRGGIVDEGALAEALRKNRLRGAALDVFASEPLPTSCNLWTVPNLLITPHVSGWFGGYLARVVQLFLTNLEQFERGDGVLTPVDREREY
jgi:phosphoglycerate dehydrogenase-like enzyme